MYTVKQVIPFNKNYFEKKAWDNSRLICGIDESGRGCLAGPVVVGAAIIPPKTSYRLLKDSKTLTKQELLQAYAWISKNCYYSYVAFDHRSIDAHNIYQATLRAMRRAFMQIMVHNPGTIETVCIDAMPLQLRNSAYESIPVVHFNKGETYSSSIAAASIVAKVNRDRIMQSYCKTIPGYAFTVHKGYGTKKHQEFLKLHGTSLIHRKSFLTKFDVPGIQNERNNQQTIC